MNYRGGLEVKFVKRPLSSEDVYKDILGKIINLELEPGTKISENRMAEEYSVSRSVVRSAFTRLAQDRFLVIYPQRGTYVKLINKNYIRTALIIRLAIEKEMLFRCMKKDDISDVVRRMEENIKQQEKFYSAKEYIEEFKKLDEEFHECIILSVENRNVLDLMREHLMHISRWRNVYVRCDDSILNIVDHHKGILNCVRNKDYAGALEMMSNHIECLSNEISSNPEFEQYFSE